MSKKIQLTIPTACHEDWEIMTPVEKGRFCGSCKKQVIDFSNMSDRQIAEFFKKPSTGSVCGRFMQDQLDRDIIIPKKRIPWVKYFFQFALPAFLVSIKAYTQTVRDAKLVAVTPDKAPRLYKTLHNKGEGLTVDTAKPSAIRQRPITCFTIITSELLMGDVKALPIREEIDSSHLVTGQVIDDRHGGVVNANIKVRATGKHVIADVNGFFTIDIGVNWQNLSLEISSVGYATKLVEINKASFRSGGIITMDPIEMTAAMMGELVVTAVRKNNKKISVHESGKQKDTTCAPVKKIIKEDNSFQFKVFPNPVSKGEPVTVDAISLKDNALEIRIISLDGHQVFSQNQQVYKGSNRFTVATGASWSAGIYLIQLLGENGTIVLQDKIIIQ